MASLSLIVVESGPDRVVDRARKCADDLRATCSEVVVVDGSASTPGTARNVGVRRSSGDCVLIVDASHRLSAAYARAALDALDRSPEAAFAAHAGAAPYLAPVGARGTAIDAPTLVGSAWSVGPAAIRRALFEDAGWFDEDLPAFVDWDLLLAIVGRGRTGIAIDCAAPRFADDDVRLREALGSGSHLPAVRRIVTKHRELFDTHMRAALVERERTAKALHEHERALLERRTTLVADLSRSRNEIATLRRDLGRYGLRSLDFGDLRRTSPISRNWGSERGVPVDRHYIHAFLKDHAADVQGHVLEMLDRDLTVQYGGDRVDRSDVLDIDPGNARATVMADLREKEQLPPAAFDCFILTQTLHLIDDMSAALATAYRALKPGGVLLVTMPCASMVATEYGARGDHWRVTEAGARAIFERIFTPGDLTIRSRGNVLTTTAFLHGLSCDDLDEDEFAADDPAYPLLITIRARKPHTTQVRVRPPEASATVLLYHRVTHVERDIHTLAISPDAFRSQMQELRESCLVLPLAELAAAAAAGDPPERAVALTFDDGYLDNLDTVAPLLAELGLPATFFLTTESRPARRRFWWDVLEEALSHDRAAHDETHAILRRSSPAVRDDILLRLARERSVPLVSERARPMSYDEVGRLKAFPSLEIGAHTVHHLSLSEVSAEDCHREVFESRSALERITGRAVRSFAYPFGAVSDEAVTAVTAAGFDVAVTCDARPVRTREHRLRIPRIAAREESGAALVARIARSAAAVNGS
jgi:peptidoglycan/xylan/chitin deacetylase (PgdA/CDA1 family)